MVILIVDSILKCQCSNRLNIYLLIVLEIERIALICILLTVGSLAWIGGVVGNLLNELALQVLLVHRLFLKLAEVHLRGLLLHHGVVHKELLLSHVIWLGL